MLQMFGLWYIFFSFTQLNKRRIFLLRRLMWLSSFYIRENVYELCFLFPKKKVAFWIHLFQRRFIFHISFKYSKVSSSVIKTFEYELCLKFDLGMFAREATFVPKFCLLLLSNLLQKTNSQTKQKPLLIK